MDLRSHFPVLERLSYLNAGSVGPVPAEAADAARAELDAQVAEGRGGKPSFEHLIELGDRLRTRVAAVMGCDTAELALTGATTDGVNTVLAGLELAPGDEILTTDEEHPGLLAPLGLAHAPSRRPGAGGPVRRHRRPRCARRRGWSPAHTCRG